jgi:diguanylate cyclase (GGDEF)-like protein
MFLYKYFLDLSLRKKFIACLLLTSLASIAVMGGLAYVRLMQKFDVLIAQDASRNFSEDVSAYFRTYGSWDEGMKRERFRNFVERRHQLMRPPLPANGLVPPPPPPENIQQTMMPMPVTPHQPKPSNLQRPPFRFYLFDIEGHALTALAPYKAGETVHASDKKKLVPIDVDGYIMAYYLPDDGQVNYSDLDLAYLAVMRQALAYGVLAGVVLTILLGWIFGNGLNNSLKALTAAATAMTNGDLRQYIKVNSKDEIGLLANTFNRMSAELANNYEELHKSHQQIQEQADQLREVSIRDTLTGLYNRRYFDQQSEVMLKQALRYQHPFSVMIGDIDHFKKINDTFSHAMGDEVLRHIGKILTSKLRASDVVARYGGEEFVIAFTETSLSQAQATCESLRQIIENHPWHELHPQLKVTMSMGLDASADIGDVHSMLQVADNHLYRAKHEGRNRVCTAA